MNWTGEDRIRAVELMRSYFAASHGVRNFDWDWVDGRYDAWLHVARTSIRHDKEKEELQRRIMNILPAVENDGHPTIGRLIRRLFCEAPY